MIGCIGFVFGAMLEYSVILLLLKLEKMNVGHYKPYKQVLTNDEKDNFTIFTCCIGSPLAIAWGKSRHRWKTTLHSHIYGLLLHLSSALPDIQYYILVECGCLEI